MNFIPIRVSTLRGDIRINFDTYIKLGDKYVLYLRAGDSFEGERLKRLKSKKLKKMFIDTNAEVNYRDYVSKNIESAYDKNSGKDIVIRAEIIQGAQQSNAEAVFENVHDEFAYSEAKGAVSKFVEFLQQEEMGLSSLLSIDNVDQNIAHHGVSVSALSVALAGRLKLTDNKQLQMLSLGALLHDYEHQQTQQKLTGETKSMSDIDLALYRQHPASAAQKLQALKHFDTQVISIIKEHEEHVDGSGYPDGLTEGKLNPLSVIVSSANAFDRMVAFEGLSKKEAHRKMLVELLGRHPLEHIQIIGSLIA